MTKVDIISGFLGAGKTTLIKKLLAESLAGTKTVLIENEFGEIGIDGGFLQESGIEIREMNAGCICCSLVGDFVSSLKEVMEKYAPDRILIEPSGVGKLSDVIRAVQDAAEGTAMEMGSAVAVVDASKAKVYLKNFGEFFVDQIAYAGTILLSRMDKCDEKKTAEAVALIRSANTKATIITTPLQELSGRQLLDAMEGKNDLQTELMCELLNEEHKHYHDHDEEECSCGFHGEHHHHEHHHDHDEEECSCGCHGEHHHHEHHHDHDEEECSCGCHGGHDHHHDADEVFMSWGMETPSRYTEEEIEHILQELDNMNVYGIVLRAKGMLPGENGGWLHYDYVPGEYQIREGGADVTGKICVIGSGLHEDALERLFAK